MHFKSDWLFDFNLVMAEIQVQCVHVSGFLECWSHDFYGKQLFLCLFNLLIIFFNVSLLWGNIKMQGKSCLWLFCDVSFYFNLHTCSFYLTPNFKQLFVVLVIGSDVFFLTRNCLMLYSVHRVHTLYKKANYKRV